MVARPPPPSFAGTDRFVVERRLGAGQYGSVYAVHDRERDSACALKLLHELSPERLARFKAEFRLLSALYHQNLARLFELHHDGGAWFFTMERIDGVDPLAWLTGEAAPADPTATASVPEQGFTPGPEDLELGPRPRPQARPRAASLDYAAIRSVFSQLAAGLTAVHERGLLHRDLKPSNILVTAAGAVKLLDFGLAELVGSAEVQPAGTRGYIAPEVWSQAPTPAADWYSVGVILYRALGGDPLAPSDSPRLPAALRADPRGALLADLCLGLLRANPDERTTGAQVRAALDQGWPKLASSGGAPFVGRAAELAALEAAFARRREGKPAVALIRGVSGVGKSTLARRLLQDLHVGHGALVFSGRCHLHEHVPLKATDGVVDTLARWLAAQPADVRASVMPARRAALLRVFPVLGLVGGGDPSDADALPPDPVEVRKSAFAILGRLLANACALAPVVLYIDDIQWGDVSSAQLLSEILLDADAPPLMLLLACRAEEDSAFLAAWTDYGTDHRLAMQTLELGPLTDDDAVHLAELLLPREGKSIDHATALAAEAGGLPIFIEELARARAGAQGGLRALIVERIAALAPAARELLTLVAISAEPLRSATLLGAAGAQTGPEIVTELELLRLLRLRERGGARLVTSYHDRVRAAALELAAPDELRRLRLRLAEALERDGCSDHGRLATLYADAGDGERTRAHSLEAAAQALEGLAFERAVWFHGLALDHMGQLDPSKDAVQRARARALVLAGRGAEAAALFEDVAMAAGEDHATLLLAAEQWMVTGHFDRGSALFRRIWRAAGQRWPSKGPSFGLRVLWDLACLRLRGRGYWTRRLEAPAADALALADLSWAGVRGFIANDHLLALYFLVRGVRLALRAGEPERIARVGLMFAGQLRSFSLAWGAWIWARCEDIRARQPTPYLDALSEFQTAMISINQGRWRHAWEAGRRSLDRFGGECVGVGWESSTARVLTCEALYQLGNLDTLQRFVSEAQARQEQLGDLAGFVGVYTYQGLCWLAKDQPEHAREVYERIVALWTLEGFHYQHLFSGIRLGYCDLYCDRPLELWRRAGPLWDGLFASGLHRAPYPLLRGLCLRASAALAGLDAHARGQAPAELPARAALVAQAAEMVERLEQLGRGDARAEARQIAAALSLDSGRAAALAELDAARERFEAEGMALRAAVCGLRRASLAGEQPAIVAAAARLRELGIASPSRWTAAFSPGFSGLPSDDQTFAATVTSEGAR